ncbi:MAG TPA: CRISPR-associated endonuclease Cas6 [Flavobacterium sp.]|nr:CRISPR-associated endonuclease Cas6 [Flavobacterium sp.]
MPKIRTLKVVFDTPLKQYEIPAFRGAIVDLVGREDTTFHNHKGENGFHYRYPKIQYKAKQGKAMIFCMEEGIEPLYQVFQNSNQEINLNGKQIALNVEDIKLNQPFLQVWDKWMYYKITDWLPLNEKNFERYITLDSEIEKLELLEKVLVGNILSMAKGLDWNIKNEVKVRITEKVAEKNITFKNVKMKGMIVFFKSNVFLPAHIGIGKGASIGHGVIHPQSSRN